MIDRNTQIMLRAVKDTLQEAVSSLRKEFREEIASVPTTTNGVEIPAPVMRLQMPSPTVVNQIHPSEVIVTNESPTINIDMTPVANAIDKIASRFEQALNVMQKAFSGLVEAMANQPAPVVENNQTIKVPEIDFEKLVSSLPTRNEKPRGKK